MSSFNALECQSAVFSTNICRHCPKQLQSNRHQGSGLLRWTSRELYLYQISSKLRYSRDARIFRYFRALCHVYAFKFIVRFDIKCIKQSTRTCKFVSNFGILLITLRNLCMIWCDMYEYILMYACTLICILDVCTFLILQSFSYYI